MDRHDGGPGQGERPDEQRPDDERSDGRDEVRGADFDEAVESLIDPFADERGVDGITTGELFDELYDVLKEIAARRMAGQRTNHTLQATALVHDAFMRLAESGKRFNSRGHFLCAVALTMRRLLLDHEERRRARKRTRPDLGPIEDEYVVPFAIDSIVSAELFDARLAKLHARGDDWAWRFLMLRFYADATMDEISDVLDTPKRTTERRWGVLRTWLRGEDRGDCDDDGASGVPAPRGSGPSHESGAAARSTD